MPKSITLTASQLKAYGEPAVRKLTDSARVSYGESCDLETGVGCSVSDIRSAREQGLYEEMPKSITLTASQQNSYGEPAVRKLTKSNPPQIPEDPIPAAMVSDMPAEAVEDGDDNAPKDAANQMSESSPPKIPEDPIPAAKISGMPAKAAEDGDDNAPLGRKNENIRMKDAVSLVKQDKMRKRDFVSSRIIRLARKIDPFEECKTETECEVFISSSDPALVEMMETEIKETVS
eukprot:CAMPEP_0185753702 /NCGR_PEP_ID=MMETSP1174-20130828/12421_1 /TAXON_ID=35687 /ORGANISM="Dictyocha speculum, Strain CCMP1381" /LENGTH=232 /DNA_ID=CAMNT_0028431669 /DNA_START=336 /DNA_END=1034 /DNA_ORIENTATION=+